MKREIIITKDGSTSIYLPELQEGYHSKNGAIQEALHVFINNGLRLFEAQNEVCILEIGFGTGLNAFITFLESNTNQQKINYVGVEAYPIAIHEALQMNYTSQLRVENFNPVFEIIHTANWNEKIQISDAFTLTKREQLFQDIRDKNAYDLIYFDAFGFNVQPELWNEPIFKIMFDALKPNGVLVTYACRTSIKRAMLSVGFSVEKLPGAPGKREMLRAVKNQQ
jgi:tRNA U34 5-methylaminomethyl-2-thiouridine-forming methyltransferase MnmC